MVPDDFLRPPSLAGALRAVAGATSKMVPDHFLWPPSLAATLRIVARATSKIVPDDFLTDGVGKGEWSGSGLGGNLWGKSVVMRIPVIAIVLFVVVVTAAFVVPVRHGGKPALDWRQVRDHWRHPGQWLAAPGSRAGGEEMRAYRWRDARGNWQYGRIPPPGVDTQSVTIKAPTVITPEEMRGGGKPAQEKQP